jgi:hypothetical protein
MYPAVFTVARSRRRYSDDLSPAVRVFKAELAKRTKSHSVANRKMRPNRRAHAGYLNRSD